MKKIYLIALILCFGFMANGQIINFPDANFKAKLLMANIANGIAKDSQNNNIAVDDNNDGQIQVAEALQVSILNINSSNISDLTSIEYFTNLKYLNCDSNQITILNITNNISLTFLSCRFNQLTTIDLTNNTNLITLACNYNIITALSVNNLINLDTLNCSNNLLTSIAINNLTNLTSFTCKNNQLSALNVINNTNLSYLSCEYNQLTSLDVSTNINLYSFYFKFNQLTSINLNTNINLANFDCKNNLLTSLDLSNNINLATLYCDNNQLTSLFIKNGRNEFQIEFNGNPNLQYICADDSQLGSVQNLIDNYGYTNCSLSSYCSFNPGGIFYTITGNSKYDRNNNGCDANDSVYPNLKFNINNGTNSGTIISNNSGNYSIPVNAGTYNISPILENPSYFNVSPSVVSFIFPAATSPAIQNFCITANGIHKDLEISLLPIDVARPGFDANYKLVYKNKGTSSQTGTIILNFNDAVLDFVSSSLFPAQTVNNINWGFSNLVPFETREILVKLNLNSPTETPPLNNADVLNYTATITGATDETPIDNTSNLSQTLVNSFDPNDKTCTEGATISPAKVGQYVHYIIRFQNDGTANAQNIVIKDIIDTTKFNISSLVPLNGSHVFTTKISDNNKVEFIFENIQLPFATGSNQGFVAFKIKTLPSLVVGDTFSNSANIYFDYNFPILTNSAVTTVSQPLSNQDFQLSNIVSIYPNPAKNNLNLRFNDKIEISSFNVYNTLGQLVLVVPSAKSINTIDISSLTSGSYLLKIISNIGTSALKFIKE